MEARTDQFLSNFTPRSDKSHWLTTGLRYVEAVRDLSHDFPTIRLIYWRH